MRSAPLSASGIGRQPQHYTLPEVMYSLSCLSALYEIGLGARRELELAELRQHILTAVSRSVHARAACLLLYYEAQQHFVSVAAQGDPMPCGLLANVLSGQEIAQLTMRGPGETLTSLQLNEERLLLVTLSYEQTLLGVIALSSADDDILQDERGLLLTYMGNVSALILHQRDLQDRERDAAIEQERERIARDLHDSVAQSLAYALQKIELLQHLLAEGNLQQMSSEFANLARIVQTSLHDMRYTIFSLVPSRLEHRTLADALAELLDSYSIDYPGIEISTAFGDLRQVPQHLETPIFRLIQESLTNISKHASATRVIIRIYWQNGQAKQLVVEINDNGAGFDVRQAESAPLHAYGRHLGLRTMRERVLEAGGEWWIESQPGNGTTIRALFLLVASEKKLTDREYEVLSHIARGLSNRAIAQRLAISSETVKAHVHHIMQKLRVKNREQAVAAATRQGWL